MANLKADVENEPQVLTILSVRRLSPFGMVYVCMYFDMYFNH